MCEKFEKLGRLSLDFSLLLMRRKQANTMRRLTGVIVSDKMKKTRVVEVTHMKKHPKYLRYYKVSQRFKAHDENEEYKMNDSVVIEETRPMSKEKRWKIIEKA